MNNGTYKKLLALALVLVMSLALFTPSALALEDVPEASGETEEYIEFEEVPEEFIVFEEPSEELNEFEGPSEALFLSDGNAVASGTCGDSLVWSLDGDGVLMISGEGDITRHIFCPVV